MKIHVKDVLEIPGTVVCTINVTGVRRFRLRLWLTGRLLALVALVSPVPVKLEYRDDG
jgi:hypothetical protein